MESFFNGLIFLRKNQAAHLKSLIEINIIIFNKDFMNTEIFYLTPLNAKKKCGDT